MTDKEALDDLEDIIDWQLQQHWTKSMISECFKRGLNKKQTIQYMYDLAEFTVEVMVELREREGSKKEVIQR